MNTSTESGTSSIGAQLKKAREARGWTIQEAARRTKLKADLLQKLEGDQFDLLPSMAYARGFVRIYSRELGLDGWTLLRQFDGEVEQTIDMLELQTEDFEAIPDRAKTPVATAQGLGLILIGAVIVFAMVIVGLKVRQVWPAIAGDGIAPMEPVPSAVVEDVSAAVLAEQAVTPRRATPVEGTEPAAPPRAEPVERPAPRAEVVEPAAPRAVPVSDDPAAVPRALPVEGMEAPAAAEATVPDAVTHLLQLRAEPLASDRERWVRVIAIRGGREEIVFEDLLPPGRVTPFTAGEAWQAEAFIITMREASAIEIIFNGDNAGKYEQSGVQRVRIPGS